MIENQYYSYNKIPEFIKWYKKNFKKFVSKTGFYLTVDLYFEYDFNIGFKYKKYDTKDIYNNWYESISITSSSMKTEQLIVRTELLGFIVDKYYIKGYKESIFNKNKHLICVSELNLL